MTRLQDRPRVQEHDDAVAETLLRTAFPDTQLPKEPPTVQPPKGIDTGTPGRPIRSLRWLALGAVLVLVVAVGAIALVNRGDDTADGWVRAVEQFGPQMDDIRTAHGWVRYFAHLDEARDIFIHL